MIFDQYSRYKACSDLLRRAGFIAGESVLDVGSGPECLMGEFMPDAAMTYVDPLIASDVEKVHITGNVFASELDDTSYDCVSAVDVFEHVPPADRDAFLRRISTLAKDLVILGFPTSDTTDASKVDKAIENQYRIIYGVDYPWLDEHHRYGLPSEKETISRLEEMGWYCQSIGHGYAPWLEELLGFVINVWEIPDLQDIVLTVSEKFNRDLYQYDFRTPCYRKFIIASRKKLSNTINPEVLKDFQRADEIFRGLMKEAHERYFISAIQTLEKYRNEKNVVLNQRDMEQAKREECLEQIHQIKTSTSWKITSPFRFVWRVLHYGLLMEDRKRVSKAVRGTYHKLPLPAAIKRIISLIYHGLFGEVYRMIRNTITNILRFRPPVINLSAQKKGRYDYIIWGVIDWHFRYQRPQQLAQAMAHTGRRVFYVSPLFVDDGRAGFEIDKLNDSGSLFQINLFVKRKPSIYKAAPSVEVIEQLKTSAGEVLNWANCGQLISLVQHPFWHDIASILPNSYLVYDCMDHHEGFGNNGESLMQLEKQLFRSADVTVTTSAWLEESISIHAQNHVLIRNATNYDYFCRRPNNVYQDAKGRKVIGYYGAIAEWFDLDLVEEVANRFAECAVVLIGEDSVNAKSRLGKLPNVSFMGEVAYDRLTYYLYGFDVCMLPFKIVPLTIATNPVKAYEYLSAGKPLVTVDLPEMHQFGELVYVASSGDEFINAVNNALVEPGSSKLSRNERTFLHSRPGSIALKVLLRPQNQ